MKFREKWTLFKSELSICPLVILNSYFFSQTRLYFIVAYKLNNKTLPGVSKNAIIHAALPVHFKQGQANYSYTSTKKKRRIHDLLNCRSKNLTYLIECKKCGKLHYIGETKRHLQQRFGEHPHSFLNGMATFLILLLSPNILIKPVTLSKTSFLFP